MRADAITVAAFGPPGRQVVVEVCQSKAQRDERRAMGRTATTERDLTELTIGVNEVLRIFPGSEVIGCVAAKGRK
jgi:hypothetical protein